jgi:hypothetical protein
LAASPDNTGAASIWERPGPFQACLEQQYEKWVQARAELVLNEDAQAGNVDDVAVARWMTATIDACRGQTGAGDSDSEARFAKHVAHWRSHIYDLVQSIGQRAGPD